MSSDSEEGTGESPRRSSIPSPLLKREEVAELLNVSLRHLDTLVASGEIIPVRIGRAVRFKPEEIQSFIDDCVDAGDSS